MECKNSGFEKNYQAISKKNQVIAHISPDLS